MPILFTRNNLHVQSQKHIFDTNNFRMTDIDILKEIEARVKFKFDELKTALKNRIYFKLKDAHDGSHDNMLIWKVFAEIEDMIDKEVTMSHPWHDDEIIRRKWRAKNAAVNELKESLDTQRGKDLQRTVIRFVRIIEKAQDY